MTLVLSVFNQCGGVSKTTLTHNLSYHLAANGRKVLVVDLDPQSSLTIFNGIDPESLNATVVDSILNNQPLPIYCKAIEGISVVPSDITLAQAELQLVSQLGRESKLKKAIAPIKEDYDFILIDCPPSLGLLSILGLCASDKVLVPIQCQYKSIKGTELLLSTVASVREELQPKLEIGAFIPTMYSSRCSQETRSLEAIHNSLGDIAPITEALPKATAFADAAEKNIPLKEYDPSHRAVKSLEKIAKQIIGE